MSARRAHAEPRTGGPDQIVVAQVARAIAARTCAVVSARSTSSRSLWKIPVAK